MRERLEEQCGSARASISSTGLDTSVEDISQYSIIKLHLRFEGQHLNCRSGVRNPHLGACAKSGHIQFHLRHVVAPKGHRMSNSTQMKRTLRDENELTEKTPEKISPRATCMALENSDQSQHGWAGTLITQSTLRRQSMYEVCIPLMYNR